MIVPSITAALALLNLVSAANPAHIRRQTVNATPAQALAASVQANSVISEIIIVIVKQAAAAAAAISNASVARTATTAVTSSPVPSVASSSTPLVSTSVTTTPSPAPVTSSSASTAGTSSSTTIATTTSSTTTTTTSTKTSSTSTSAVTSSYTPPTRSSSFPPQSSSGTSTSICLAPTTTAGSDTTPLPNIINMVRSAPVCQSICQLFEDQITSCVNNFSDGLSLARCSCQTGFINNVAKCAVCIDSYLGRQTLAYGNATYFCQQCSASSVGFQPAGSCGSNTDLSFCGLTPIPPPTVCPSGSGSAYPGAACKICQAGTYSVNSKCVYCQNDNQYSLANSTSCINCNSTLGVQTCNTYNNGYAQTCTTGFHLFTDVAPAICLPNCDFGAGVDPATNTCYACPAGTRVNSYRCTACFASSYSLGNSTYCTGCPYNGLTQFDSTCSSTSGAPLNCKTNFALAGSVGNFTCAACTTGTSSSGGAQKCT